MKDNLIATGIGLTLGVSCQLLIVVIIVLHAQSHEASRVLGAFEASGALPSKAFDLIRLDNTMKDGDWRRGDVSSTLGTECNRSEDFGSLLLWRLGLNDRTSRCEKLRRLTANLQGRPLYGLGGVCGCSVPDDVLDDPCALAWLAGAPARVAEQFPTRGTPLNQELRFREFSAE